MRHDLDRGLPAWVGPLCCGGCARAGTLILDGSTIGSDEQVSCLVCGWTGGLWLAEERTLLDLLAELHGRRRASDQIDGPPPARLTGGRRLGDPATDWRYPGGFGA